MRGGGGEGAKRAESHESGDMGERRGCFRMMNASKGAMVALVRVEKPDVG